MACKFKDLVSRKQLSYLETVFSFSECLKNCVLVFD